MIRELTFVFGFTLLPQAALAAGCGAGDFEMLTLTPTVEDDCIQSPCKRYKLVGEVRNNCRKSAGVKIQIVGRDKSGKAIASWSGWPASISNISPGATFVFDFGPAFDYDKRIVTFVAQPIEAQTWKAN